MSNYGKERATLKVANGEPIGSENKMRKAQTEYIAVPTVMLVKLFNDLDVASKKKDYENWDSEGTAAKNAIQEAKLLLASLIDKGTS